MTMNQEEYEQMKAEEEASKREKDTEARTKREEFRDMRRKEIQAGVSTRVHIASRVAAGLAGNPQMEADSVARRAIDVADSIMKLLKEELDSYG